LPFASQRLCSRRLIAGARYRKNTCPGVHEAALTVSGPVACIPVALLSPYEVI
jgi:hypothetical protein